jgi:hypothetical protein
MEKAIKEILRSRLQPCRPPLPAALVHRRTQRRLLYRAGLFIAFTNFLLMISP